MKISIFLKILRFKFVNLFKIYDFFYLRLCDFKRVCDFTWSDRYLNSEAVNDGSIE